MITFSLNGVTGVDTHAIRVLHVINTNINYFKHFNPENWEEAAHRTYLTAVENRDPTYGDNILPYIKKLARTILKVKQNESAYGVFTDEGEISPVYYSLVDNINTDSLDGTTELFDIFKELYLMDTESFMKLQSLHVYNDLDEVDNIKALRIKNPQMHKEIRKLIYKYGADYTFRALYDFFGVLPQLTTPRQTGLIKDVVMKPSNYVVLEKIPDTPLIIDADGNYHQINKNTLTMDVNPDYLSWDIIGTSLCDILKIDLCPFLSYMYEEVYVAQGVNTRHIAWCGEKYRLETPGGETYIGLDFEKFISLVRVELILNLMLNGIGAVVAISPDNMYIKPTRSFKFDKIRLKFRSGKLIDLPITVHLKKRK